MNELVGYPTDEASREGYFKDLVCGGGGPGLFREHSTDVADVLHFDDHAVLHR